MPVRLQSQRQSFVATTAVGWARREEQDTLDRALVEGRAPVRLSRFLANATRSRLRARRLCDHDDGVRIHKGFFNMRTHDKRIAPVQRSQQRIDIGESGARDVDRPGMVTRSRGKEAQLTYSQGFFLVQIPVSQERDLRRRQFSIGRSEWNFVLETDDRTCMDPNRHDEAKDENPSRFAFHGVTPRMYAARLSALERAFA